VGRRLDGAFEPVFVVDGSPDRSLELLQEMLPSSDFPSQIISLSRRFGSFAAIRANLASGSEDLFAVMAADLQKQPELIVSFQDAMQSGRYDVAVGCRDSRSDPLPDRLFSIAFWELYRTFVQREVPRGGVDVFGCTGRFRAEILRLRE